MDRGVGDADRAHQPELGLHEQVLQRVFGDRRQRAIHAERAGAMAHGVELEVAERDRFHVAVGGMIVDPVLVAAEAVARLQHRRVLVGGSGELVEPAAGKGAEAVEVGLEPAKVIGLQIEPEQVAQAAIDGIEILSRTIRRDVIGAMLRIVRRGGAGRGVGRRRVHGGPRFGSSGRPAARRRGRLLNIGFRPAIPILSDGCGATQAMGLRHFR